MDATPLITVPLPTITGREDFLEAAVAAYERYANVEVLVFKDEPGCGPAWAKGAAAATGDYIHFGADDVQMHQGWWQAATRVIDMGYLPAARVLNTDGSLQSCGDWGVEMRDGAIPEFTRSPMVSRAQWERMSLLIAPFLEQNTQYFTDNIFTAAGRHLGIETVVCRGYEYTHHLAKWGRGAGMSWEQRMRRDQALYLKYLAGGFSWTQNDFGPESTKTAIAGSGPALNADQATAASI